MTVVRRIRPWYRRADVCLYERRCDVILI